MKKQYRQPDSWKIEGILFDFDGTLTKSGLIDFHKIKEDIGCPGDIPVLEFIEAIADNKEKEKAFKILEDAEENAALNTAVNKGASDVLQWIFRKKIPCGILTRNNRSNVLLSLKKFEGIEGKDFSCIISRDDKVEPKPHEAGVFLAADKMRVDPQRILVVGDYHFDVEAGRRAGALTSFITNGNDSADVGDADFVIASLEELAYIIDLGLPVEGGKLPHHILEMTLKNFSARGHDVIVGPGTGEDSAVVSPEKNSLLTITSDPITFTTEDAGTFAVHVNANDVATSGAEPKWFMMTLLLPAGSSPSEGVKIIREADALCERLGIGLCGGHTEFTDAVTRPVVSGTMIGTVHRDNLKNKGSMKEGNIIIMTRAAGIEGTAVIALNFEERLIAGGIDPDLIKTAGEFAAYISIVKEAHIAARYRGVTAMHDVTEGGIVTALDEFSAAGGQRLNVDIDAIPVYQETEVFCSFLGLDPLGLIGSGSLLISVDSMDASLLMKDLEKSGTHCSVIGSAGPEGRGVDAVSWPVFKVDEITKLFSGTD